MHATGHASTRQPNTVTPAVGQVARGVHAHKCLPRATAAVQATCSSRCMVANSDARHQLSYRSVRVAAYQPDGDGFTGASNDMQEARIIVVTSGKGGVGKTTTSANFGMSIARMGYKVCVIDADIGLRNLDLLLGLEERTMYTAIDILDGECRLDQALIRDKRLKNLSMLSMSRNRQRYNITRAHMAVLCDSIIALGYQFIILDCPAGIDVGFINAISPAKEAVLVVTPEITSIRDADRVAGLLEANGIYNVKLLVNRVRPDMIKKNDMMSVKDVQEMLGVPLLGAIPEDEEAIVSTNIGQPLVLREQSTISGVAYEAAAQRLVGRLDFFVDLENPHKGILQIIGEKLFGN